MLVSAGTDTDTGTDTGAVFLEIHSLTLVILVVPLVLKLGRTTYPIMTPASNMVNDGRLAYLERLLLLLLLRVRRPLWLFWKRGRSMIVYIEYDPLCVGQCCNLQVACSVRSVFRCLQASKRQATKQATKNTVIAVR